ncbi:MAG: hypothetical protein AAF587_19435 [Bacteroidota bacterium]
MSHSSNVLILIPLLFCGLCACQEEDKPHQLVESNQIYYQGNLGLVSQQGIMVFFPTGSLMKGRHPYEGELSIDLASHDELRSRFEPSKDSPIREIQNPKNLFVVRSQEDSMRSDLYIANSKRILLFVPVVGGELESYQLIHSPDELAETLFEDGFLGKDRHLASLSLTDPSSDALQRILYHDPDKNDQQAIESYLEKQQSYQELEDFLDAGWQESQRRFKQSQELYLDEGDFPETVSYYALSMNYLRDPPPDSALIYSIRDHMKDEAFVIMDWTGSMYRFRPELEQFLKESTEEKKIKFISFYNDLRCNEYGVRPGDFRGVYTHTVAFPSQSEVSSLMRECETGGYGGGELEENDLEAVVKSLQRVRNDQFQEIALIIDNNAQPKDMALLPRIRLPSEITLNLYICRANAFHDVHPGYLRVAQRFDANVILVSTQEKQSIHQILGKDS